MESYQKEDFYDGSIFVDFVQDNQVKTNKKCIIRGLHYQLIHPQAKLIRVIRGEIYDVAVDIRKKSPTFKKWVGKVLNDKDKLQMFIPPGFAHGYCTLTENTEVIYKCSEYYDPKDERGIAWDDPDISIKWPINNPILSSKDQNNSLIKKAKLPD